MSWTEIGAAIGIATQYKCYIRWVTVDMHVFTSNRFNHSGGCPHTNAPAISGVWLRTDAIIPHPLHLISYLPEILPVCIPWDGSTARRVVNEFCTYSMSAVVVAFKITITITLSWTNVYAFCLMHGQWEQHKNSTWQKNSVVHSLYNYSRQIFIVIVSLTLFGKF